MYAGRMLVALHLPSFWVVSSVDRIQAVQYDLPLEDLKGIHVRVSWSTLNDGLEPACIAEIQY
jgi:hypothetical protein